MSGTWIFPEAVKVVKVEICETEEEVRVRKLMTVKVGYSLGEVLAF